MNPDLAFVVGATGFLIMMVGVVGANVAFFRSLPMMLNRESRSAARSAVPSPTRSAARSAVFTFAFWLVAWAAVAMLGMTVMVFGIVLDGDVVTWAPILPLTLVVVTIPLAWYIRWRAQDEVRNS